MAEVSKQKDSSQTLPALTPKQIENLKRKLNEQVPATAEFPPKIENSHLNELDTAVYGLKKILASKVANSIESENISTFLHAFKEKYSKVLVEKQIKMETAIGRNIDTFDQVDINFEISGDNKVRFLNELYLPSSTRVSLSYNKDSKGQVSLNLTFQKPPAAQLTDILAYVVVPNTFKLGEASFHISPQGEALQKAWKLWFEKCKADLSSLEALASNTHKNGGGKSSISNSPSSSLKFYSLGLAGFDYDSFFENLRKEMRLPEILVADIGGGMGTAANDLEKNPRIRSFVIDPFYQTPGKMVKTLPEKRFIVSKIEQNSIPDNSFHGLMTFNTLEYTDLFKSLSEAYRILKPGGKAVIEYELWCTNHRRMEDLPDNIKKNLEIHFYRMKRGQVFDSNGPYDFDYFLKYRSQNMLKVDYIKPGEILSSGPDGVVKMVKFRKMITSQLLANGEMVVPVFILKKPNESL